MGPHLPRTFPSPTVLIAVVAGGGRGTLARYGVGQVISGVGSTLAVNLLGAFALGLLSGWAPWHQLQVRGQVVQSFFTTGLLGGFTTYSALAHELTSMPWAPAIGYAAVTLLGGVALAVSGIVMGRSIAGRAGPDS